MTTPSKRHRRSGEQIPGSTQRTTAECPNTLTTSQEDELVASPVPSNIHFNRQKTNEGEIEGQATNNEESSFSKFFKERLEQIRDLSKRPDVYKLLLNAIVLFVHEDIKKGILLQLFGGTKKNFTDAKRKTFRSQINILLCGDSNTGKSQLQQYICRLVPRAQYTNGKGTNAVGVTGYVTKDPEIDQFVLQIDASSVVADDGIFCIDEFNKNE